MFWISWWNDGFIYWMSWGGRMTNIIFIRLCERTINPNRATLCLTWNLANILECERIFSNKILLFTIRLIWVFWQRMVLSVNKMTDCIPISIWNSEQWNGIINTNVCIFDVLLCILKALLFGVTIGIHLKELFFYLYNQNLNSHTNTFSAIRTYISMQQSSKT